MVDKRRKKRPKKKKKKSDEVTANLKKTKVNNYLKSWSERNETGDWRFNKSIQNWLIKRWADSLDDDNFKVFVDYAGSLDKESKARQTIAEIALKKIKENPDEKLLARCQSLVQILV